MLKCENVCEHTKQKMGNLNYWKSNASSYKIAWGNHVKDKGWRVYFGSEFWGSACSWSGATVFPGLCESRHLMPKGLGSKPAHGRPAGTQHEPLSLSSSLKMVSSTVKPYFLLSYFS